MCYFNSNKLATDIKKYRDWYLLTNEEMCRILQLTEQEYRGILKTKIIPSILQIHHISVVLNRLPKGRNIYSYIKD